MEYWIFLDQFILSESESSDDEPIERAAAIRVKNYVEDVVDKLSEDEFRQNFRMNRVTFNHILQQLEPMIATTNVNIGRNRISAKKQLLLTLWYFGTPDSYRSICGRFDVPKSCGLYIVHRVTNALLNFAPTYIQWPTEEYAQEIRREMNRGVPDSIGAIDGCYIPIPKPKENGISYICRKNFPCIILQAVWDHKMLFTNCYAGEVGSCHDATVLRRSEIWEYMQNPEQYFPNDSHLIGDKAYPLLQNIMTPYRDNGRLTQAQMAYNQALCSARNIIERAFGLLKRRFRILKFMDVRTVEWIPKYIIACCVLHNICILQGDIFNIEEVIPEDADEDLNADPPQEREQREKSITYKRYNQVQRYQK